MHMNPVSQRVLIVLIVVATAGLASAERGQVPAAPLPEIKKDCSLCHLDIQKGPALKKTVSDLCIDCHPDRKAPNEHKVDIVPSMQVKTLPLSAGKITCITCHDPHRNTYGKLLRVPQNKLCSQCHRM
jgi:predicted CXXCH cytochrome family protein